MKVRGGEVMIVLDKTHMAFWPRLTREKKRPPFVSVDFERWKEESGSDGEREGNCHLFGRSVCQLSQPPSSGTNFPLTSPRRRSSITHLVTGQPAEIEHESAKYHRILGSTSSSSSENYEDEIDDILY